MEDYLLQEKNVMLMTSNPFIIKLLRCFQDEQFCYFVLEIAHGGSLYNLLNKRVLMTEVRLWKSFFLFVFVCSVFGKFVPLTMNLFS